LTFLRGTQKITKKDMPKVATGGRDMIEVFGARQKQLMRLLLKNKGGMTVDELALALKVTRNAVRQHLATLSKNGFVAPGRTRPTRGRPQQLHVLTDAGKEAFPRHYSWFAQLLVDAIAGEHGAEGLRTRLGRVAAAVATQLQQRGTVNGNGHGAPNGNGTPVSQANGAPGGDLRQRVARLAGVMDELGYDARVGADVGANPAIEADNCVFHELAKKNPEICHFDLALLSAATDSKVEHHECMARGGNVCRFKFTARR
jgi:predicted ArsR family transcriptional regulator